jgi:predicted RNA-binding Zn-ribbon protein involved in translation (DUF1610 family)
MAEVIDCPSCRRKLKLPLELRGQDVKCPTCGATFTAAFAEEPLAPPVARPVAEAPPAEAAKQSRRRDPELAHCPHCGAMIARTAKHCRRCQALLDLDSEDVRYWEPHRGGMILTLGILSALFGTLSLCCGAPALLGLGFGIPAWVMASQDIHRMRVGQMDRNGMANTQSGQSYAMVGVVLSLLCGVGYGLLFLAKPGLWL